MDGDFRNFAWPVPPVPEDIADRVIVDTVAQIITVDGNKRLDPSFLTFLQRCKNGGFSFEIKSVPYDEIVKMMRGISVEQKSSPQLFTDAVDMGNRDAAIGIIKKAVAYGATDIHIHRQGTHAEVLFRINRSLHAAGQVKMEEGEAIDRAIYTGLATSKSGNYLSIAYQDAEISGDLTESLGLEAIRIVRGPCYPHNKRAGIMVARLQTDRDPEGDPGDLEPLLAPRVPEGTVDFTRLGYSEAQTEKLLYLSELMAGCILFTGPVNSGKTTTMYNMFKHIAQIYPDLRQLVLERPVERPMNWAVQIPIIGHFIDDTEEGLAIAGYIKNMLRMDFNVGGINEIRLGQVVHAMIQLIETGHKIISSLHVTCAHRYSDRLLSMTRESMQREDFCDHEYFPGIISQRLVPLLCPSCSQPISAAPERRFTPRQVSALKSFSDYDAIRIRGDGCRVCQGTGVTHMTAVAEIVVTDEEYMKILRDRGAAAARSYYRAKEGADPSVMRTAMSLVLAGRADPRDVSKFVDAIRHKSELDA